ncbi:hypothetical protein BCR43DRAFT_508923 [Syncephalastrum racemosum]|uniref:Uncharacterized protein n=1 Tax=Syncephalastrum racemosum TaxID=13706 RepID=A0A1X2H099_SYNRA|nr:hypothetical protein BCR43DRAFT_508923 [Syncephalastrum racemosum]
MTIGHAEQDNTPFSLRVASNLCKASGDPFRDIWNKVEKHTVLGTLHSRLQPRKIKQEQARNRKNNTTLEKYTIDGGFSNKQHPSLAFRAGQYSISVKDGEGLLQIDQRSGTEVSQLYRFSALYLTDYSTVDRFPNRWRTTQAVLLNMYTIDGGFSLKRACTLWTLVSRYMTKCSLDQQHTVLGTLHSRLQQR